MNYLKSRISLVLAIVMIAMLAFPFVTLASSDSPYIDMSVTLNGKELVKGNTYHVRGGEKVVVKSAINAEGKKVYPNAGIYMVGYYFEGMTEIKDEFVNDITITIPKANAGMESILYIEAVSTVDKGDKPNTLTKTGWQGYKFIWDEAEDSELDFDLKMGSKVIKPDSTTSVSVGTKLNIDIKPLDLAQTIYYRVDEKDTFKLDPEDSTLVIPEDFNDGKVHRLDIRLRDNKGNDTPVKTYFFKIELPEDDELEILPWEKENKDLEALAVSLRNDPESEKANKNVYALGEKVTYFVDYKNGGKDIKAPVELKLELPLEFDLISADGGKVDNAKRTITWNFPNGLENEAAGTKVVEIEYVKFDKKSTDSETVYPLATISKDNKVADESAVINFIYRDEDTVIEDLHTPYMFGDKDRPTFRPDDSISRAEGALVLTRILLGQNAINNVKIASEYPDLGETYLEAQKAIVAATKYGIINGYTDGYYRPNTKMTRAEFMKILAKYIEINAEDEGIDGLEIKSVENRITLYKNVVKRYVVGNTTVSEHWAIEEVSLLERLNMTSVDGKNKDLRLDEEITRAEVAQLVNFFLLRAPAETNSKTKSGFEDVSKKHELFADIIEATREAHEFTITLDGTEIAE